MVKFSEDLWDGFDATSLKAEQGIQVVKDIQEFLKKRAEIEATYAKSLAALCKTVPGSSGGLFGSKSSGTLIEKETKTLKVALISIQEEGNKAAIAHQEFANKILGDVVKPLESFIKTKDLERKKLSTDGQKRIKALADTKSAAEKAKDVYLRATKEAETATEQHEKAKNDLSGASESKKYQEAEKRLGQKVPGAVEKAKASEAAYTKAVDTANETITKSYSEHLPPIIDSLQQLEEERYKHIQVVLTEFVNSQRNIPTNLEERCQEIERNVSSIDVESDLSDFAQSHKSAATEAELIKNISSSSKELSSKGSSSATTTTTSSETKEEEKKNEPEENQAVMKEEEGELF